MAAFATPAVTTPTAIVALRTEIIALATSGRRRDPTTIDVATTQRMADMAMVIDTVGSFNETTADGQDSGTELQYY